MGRILGAMDLTSTDINTKGFEALLNLVNNTANDSFELYYGLFLYNQNATGEGAGLGEGAAPRGAFQPRRCQPTPAARCAVPGMLHGEAVNPEAGRARAQGFAPSVQFGGGGAPPHWPRQHTPSSLDALGWRRP